ncbi:MAG: hypothetical protein WA849_01005 [Candidatus Udaeobacter sp.]
MKKVIRSMFGTLMVAAFLAIVPPTYARGGHGGGHGGHAVKGHAAAGHVRGGQSGFRARGGHGHYVARATRGQARFAGRAYNWNGGRHWGGGGQWGGNYWYPSSGYSLGYYGLGYGYPSYGIGYYGYPYGGYNGPYYGYYPYRYGYWPSVSFSFGY